MVRKERQALAWCYEPGRVEAGVDEAGRGCLAGPVYAAAVVWPSAEQRPDVAADPRLALVRDSKTLSPAQRERARAFVEASAVAYAVASASAAEIDRINILRASHRAMHRALDLLLLPPTPTPTDSTESTDSLAARGGAALDHRGVEFIIADGDRFKVYLRPGPASPRNAWNAWNALNASDASSDDQSGFVPHACFPGGDNRFLAIAAASVLAKTHRDAHVRAVLHAAHPQYGFDVSKGYGTAAHLQALERHGPCPEHRRSFGPVRRLVQAVAGDSSDGDAEKTEI